METVSVANLSCSPFSTVEVVVEWWIMPRAYFVITMAVLTSTVLLAASANTLLVVTIWLSPSLKTPPNAHLVNICSNNLALCLAGLFAILSLVCSGFDDLDPRVVRAFGDVYLLLGSTCFLHYWLAFAAIGYYRTVTLRRPSLQLKTRRRLISRTIVLGWTLATGAALGLILASVNVSTSVNWNPFRRRIHVTDLIGYDSLGAGQTVLVTVIVLMVLAAVVVMAYSYYWILKTLFRNAPVVCASNRIMPWSRTANESSDG